MLKRHFWWCTTVIHHQHQASCCYVPQSIILQKKNKKEYCKNMMLTWKVNILNMLWYLYCWLRSAISPLYSANILSENSYDSDERIMSLINFPALGWNLTDICKYLLAFANIVLKCEYNSNKKPVWKPSTNLAKFRHRFYSQGLSLIRTWNPSEERVHKIISK